MEDTKITGDMTGLIANAADLAHERLDIKLEHDDFAGPGGHSYTREDVESIRGEMQQLAHLNFLLAGLPKMRAVVLSEEAFAVLCGTVHPTDDVNTQGIFSEAWEELRQTFPLDYFKKVANERGEDFYNEDAGL